MFCGLHLGGFSRFLAGCAVAAALMSPARAEPVYEYRAQGLQLSVDMAQPRSTHARLEHVMSVSGRGPVEPLLVPATRAERWRYSVSMFAVLGFGVYRHGGRMADATDDDPIARLDGAGGGSVYLSWQTPDNRFGATLRVHANGMARLMIERDAHVPPAARAGSGLLPVVGISYTPPPAVVPLPPTVFLFAGGLAALGAARRLRRGRTQVSG